MKRIIACLFALTIVVISSVGVSGIAVAQSRYWIEFRDKGTPPECFIPGSTEFESARASLSQQCLERRSHAQGKPELDCISLKDAPVFTRYLDSLRTLGIIGEVRSKWANAVSASLTKAQCKLVASLSFVKAIVPVGSGVQLSTQPIQCTPFALPAKRNSSVSDSVCGYDSIIYHYGLAQFQLDRINVWPLHAMGFDGSGVRLGFLDCGFRWRENTAFQHLKVLSEYDYIFHDSVTENQPGQDSTDQDGHGTETLSCVAAYLPDTLIGPALGATFMLAKTEWVPTEHHIEEDNYAAALEDMEAKGVDITSSSLGYFAFDAPDTSYTYRDMNGHTTIVAQAVERATKLGVLVVTAAGNSGRSSVPYIESPADADSILAVGALNVDDTIADFSSRGPTSDGRIKPDVCAPGVSVWTQTRDGGFAQANGTSFATPLTAGACCLIKQAHPLATAQQIRRAMMITGANANHPDTAYGWGKINAYAAALELGTIVHIMHASVDSEVHLCVGAAAKRGVKTVELRYFGDSDLNPHTALFHLEADSLIYSLTMPITTVGSRFFYQVNVVDSNNKGTTEPPSRWDTLKLPPRSGVNRSQNIAELKISVFPNPSTEQFHILSNKAGRYSLTDPLGREILFAPASANVEASISTVTLPNGAYYLKFMALDGTSETIPLLVSH